MKRFFCFFVIVILFGTTFSACVVFPVKPWERDLLAEKQMQLTPDSVEANLEEHTYFSKEAASGGKGVGGGGCGCN